MKTKSLTYWCTFFLIGFFSFFALTSFTFKKPCNVWCEWKPSRSNLAGAGYYNCNGALSHSTIVVGQKWVPTLSISNCGTVTISTVLPSPHLSGILRIWKNNTPTLQTVIAGNGFYIWEEEFDAVCGDSFEVTWSLN